MKTFHARSLATAVFCATFLMGCSNESDTQVSAPASSTPQSSVATTAGLLSYIPSSSPYFFASRDVLSEKDALELIERSGYFRYLDEDLATLRDYRDQADSTEEATILDIVLSVGKELTALKTLEDFHNAGLKPNAHSAIYGLGLVPVLRVELHDESAFETMIQRVLTDANLTPIKKRFEDIQYWSLGGSDEWPVELVLAIHDQQAIFTLLPSTADNDVLASILGHIKPTDSLANTPVLAQLEQRHAFTPYGAGQVSSARVFSELSQPEHIASQALFNAIEMPAFDAGECQQDIDRLIKRFPGLTIGMKEYGPDRFQMNTILETDSALAADLKTFAAKVPGLGQADSLASIGLGLNLPVLIQALQRYALEVQQAPFNCDDLQGINGMWVDISDALNNPMLLMSAPAITGLKLRIDSLFVQNYEPSGTGILTLASPNAQGLLSMASSFVPQIAALGLSNNGEVKNLSPDMLPPGMPSVSAALSSDALTVGFGIDTPSVISDALKAPSNSEPLMLYGHLTDHFYSALIPFAEQMSPFGDELSGNELSRYSSLYKNTELWIKADDYGLEIGFAVELK
ncbi:hypothetical protein [Nitrincola alkalisediminis]|nr:hypothetical protein [Nitrincola alkalisediminis]